MQKPTLYQLCTTHKLESMDTLFMLAKQSGVPKSIIDVMLINSPVEESDAVKVLNALSQMTGQTWTLEHVDVKLVEISYG